MAGYNAYTYKLHLNDELRGPLEAALAGRRVLVPAATAAAAYTLKWRFYHYKKAHKTQMQEEGEPVHVWARFDYIMISKPKELPDGRWALMLYEKPHFTMEMLDADTGEPIE